MDKNNKITRYLYKLLSVLILMGIWKLLTLRFSPLIVPPIGSVARSLVEIITTKKLYSMIFITMVRLFIGLTIGVSLGLISGILMGRFRTFKALVSPIIGLIQTVPPVSWVALALVWFGFNGKPAIFIVIIAAIPVIALNVEKGIENIDEKLLQMGELYHFSKKKQFMHIILPSIMSYFTSAFKITLGIGWKIAVMGEVLTTNTGIGGMIKQARINVEPENIIAWSAIIVLLFYLSDFLLTFIFFREERHHAGS